MIYGKVLATVSSVSSVSEYQKNIVEFSGKLSKFTKTLNTSTLGLKRSLSAGLCVGNVGVASD